MGNKQFRLDEDWQVLIEIMRENKISVDTLIKAAIYGFEVQAREYQERADTNTSSVLGSLMKKQAEKCANYALIFNEYPERYAIKVNRSQRNK